VKVVFGSDAWEDYTLWAEQGGGALARVNALIESARRTPHAGLGKPEPLKGDLAGCWSRRITGEHRLVYRVEGKAGVDQRIEILQCRRHY